MFDFFKNKSKKNAEIMNMIFEEIFIQLQEDLLLQMIRDGVIYKLNPVQDGYFNIVYGEKSGYYEQQKPKINVVFSKIKLQDVNGNISNFEFHVEDNLFFRLHISNPHCDWKNIVLINTDFVEKKSAKLTKEIKEKMEKFGFSTKNIPASDIYEIDIDGKIYLHLKDIGDGDFIGLFENELYLCEHFEAFIAVIPHSLYDFFRKNLFDLNYDEIQKVLYDIDFS